MRTQERMRQFAPMRVRPSRVTPGWMIVPRPMVTPSSMNVVEGSRIVTPSAWRASRRAWLIMVSRAVRPGLQSIAARPASARRSLRGAAAAAASRAWSSVGLAQRLELGFLAQRVAVLGVELEGARQVTHRALLVALGGQRDAEHVLGRVVVGLLLERRGQQADRPVDGAGVQRERRGVDLFLGRLGRGVGRRQLALADADVELGALVQLDFLGELGDHALQRVGGLAVALGLQGLEAALVEQDRVGVRAAP